MGDFQIFFLIYRKKSHHLQFHNFTILILFLTIIETRLILLSLESETLPRFPSNSAVSAVAESEEKCYNVSKQKKKRTGIFTSTIESESGTILIRHFCIFTKVLIRQRNK